MSLGGRHKKTTSPFRLAFRRTAIGTLSFVAASSGVGVAQAHGLLADVAIVQGSDAAQSVTDPLTARIDHLQAKHDCSTEGLAAGVVPARTVVLVDGEVRVAPFDEGWAMHQGDIPGTLVSVCAR
jgi:hypothetical protein